MSDEKSGGIIPATVPSDSHWGRAVWQMTAIVALGSLIGLATNHLRSDRIALVADWSLKGQLASIGAATGENIVIPFEDAQVLFLSNEAVFLDARPEAAYRMGHIERARSLPWEDFEARFPEVMADVSPDARIITYCDGESCSLSKELATVLLARGFRGTRVLLNGWSAWMEANLPIEG